MTPLDDRSFLFITGKGGAGKTTVTASLARALADRGRRVLITLTEPKERISALYGSAPLGPDIAEIAPNISAVKIEPERALREYGEMILKSRALYGAVFDNRYVRSFLAAAPGLYQWAMLGKAWFHSTETLPGGRPRFDVVLFDAPATGHGIEMLRVPKVILDIAPPGLLRRDAERAWTLFKDAKRSGVIIVALPEDMPANEAIELAGVVRGELGLPIAGVVVNAVVAPLFEPEERRQLLDNLDLDSSDPGDDGLSAAIRRAIGEHVQEQSLAKIESGIDAPKIHLPRLIGDASTPEGIRRLAAVLVEAAL